MPFGLIPNTGSLFKFFQKYGIGTVEEIIAIIFNGFDTKTTGVYNPIFDTPKWRNTKEDPYTKEKFEFYYLEPLMVISNKERNKKVRLGITCSQKPIFRTDSLYVNQEIQSKGFTSINVIKSCIDNIKSNKLNILGKIRGYSTDSITIKTWLKETNVTPIGVKLWTKVKTLSKLGVLLLVDCYDNTRISDSTYILDDIGNISDIEMIEMIGEINEIRH